MDSTLVDVIKYSLRQQPNQIATIDTSNSHYKHRTHLNQTRLLLKTYIKTWSYVTDQLTSQLTLHEVVELPYFGIFTKVYNSYLFTPGAFMALKLQQSFPTIIDKAYTVNFALIESQLQLKIGEAKEILNQIAENTVILAHKNYRVKLNVGIGYLTISAQNIEFMYRHY